jgi:hypothetical protein
MSLTDLIERVEGATGPDRHIDRAIWYALVQDNPPAGEKDPTHAALYTTSLDAALALCERVLPKYEVELFQRFRGDGWGVNWRAKHLDTAYAPTPALALILAMLKAIQAKDPTP